MIKVPLKSECFALIDDEDFDLVNQHRWCLYDDKSGPNLFYVLTRLYDKTTKKQQTISMHRLVMGCKHGDGKQIDHIDGNGLNNQKNNLRFCTGSQNCMNRIYPNSTSQYKGVTWKKANKRWCAQTIKEGKKKHIGLYDIEEDAARAYDKVAMQEFGSFAKLNFPIEALRND